MFKITLTKLRVRAVQCPSDMIDQIGGWSTAGVGQSYGEGYELKSTEEIMGQIVEISEFTLTANPINNQC
jgi:hypothetical protein